MRHEIDFDTVWPLANTTARIRMSAEAEHVRDVRRLVGLSVVLDYKDWERQVAEPVMKASGFTFHQAMPIWRTIDGTRQVDAVDSNGDYVTVSYTLPPEVCVKHVLGLILAYDDPRARRSHVHAYPERRRNWERRNATR